MNGVYLRALDPRDVRRQARAVRARAGLDWPEERVREAAPLVQEKIGRLGEFPAFAGFLFGDVEPDPADLDERDPRRGRAALEDLEPWTPEAIETSAQGALRRLGEKPRTGVRADPGGGDRLEASRPGSTRGWSCSAARRRSSGCGGASRSRRERTVGR